jgi:hypothetical protein
MRPRSGCLRHPSLAGAALAQRHSTFRLAVLADELRDVSARLDAFDASDLHVNLRAELPSSVDTLSLRAASLFALLGIAPASDISRTAGASLLARSGNEVRAELAEQTPTCLGRARVRRCTPADCAACGTSPRA